MKKELKNTSHLVKVILEKYEMARNSDNYLYLKVLQHMGMQVDSMPVSDFLLSMAYLGYPGFETVRRTRQKLQGSSPNWQDRKRLARCAKTVKKASGSLQGVMLCDWYHKLCRLQAVSWRRSLSYQHGKGMC